MFVFLTGINYVMMKLNNDCEQVTARFELHFVNCLILQIQYTYLH